MACILHIKRSLKAVLETLIQSIRKKSKQAFDDDDDDNDDDDDDISPYHQANLPTLIQRHSENGRVRMMTNIERNHSM